MPTGYTAAIADDVSFEQFVLSCARAMGALIMMRDEPSNAPIPEMFEPSHYYKDSAVEIEQEIAEVEAMTEWQAEQEAEKEANYKTVTDAQSAKEKKELEVKYLKMLDKVRDWKPPTKDHIGFKVFMIEQIQESIRWDCKIYEKEACPKLSGSEWKTQKLEDLRKRHDSYLKSYAEEVERTEERNRWIAALRKSLETGGNASA